MTLSVKNLLLSLLFLAVFVSGVVYFLRTKKSTEQIVCTQEAKQCPDGSYVVRIGPSCEFALCSEGKADLSDWKTYRNEQYGFEVKYPREWTILKAPFDLKGINLSKDSKRGEISLIFYEDINDETLPSVKRKTFDDWIKDANNFQFQNPQVINFLGNKAYGAVLPANAHKNIIAISHNNHIYVITYKNLEMKSINEEIVSTFKFIQ